MGSTWALLIPAAILMARLRNTKGWWLRMHRALAVASLFLVVVGAILGRRLRITHPPVTTAGKLHKAFGYTALSFICVQVTTSTGDSSTGFRSEQKPSIRSRWKRLYAGAVHVHHLRLPHICCINEACPCGPTSPTQPPSPIYHYLERAKVSKLSDNSLKMCLHVMLLCCALVVVPHPCYACLSAVFLVGCVMLHQNVIGHVRPKAFAHPYHPLPCTTCLLQIYASGHLHLTYVSLHPIYMPVTSCTHLW